jgi:hypothetical protein
MQMGLQATLTEAWRSVQVTKVESNGVLSDAAVNWCEYGVPLPTQEDHVTQQELGFADLCILSV